MAKTSSTTSLSTTRTTCNLPSPGMLMRASSRVCIASPTDPMAVPTKPRSYSRVRLRRRRAKRKPSCSSTTASLPTCGAQPATRSSAKRRWKSNDGIGCILPEATKQPFVTTALQGALGPIVAVSDYMKMVPDQVGRWIPRRFVTLGTDGFGRSDTREALRASFEVDTGHVVVATLSGLAADGVVESSVVNDAIERYGIDTEVGNPFDR